MSSAPVFAGVDVSKATLDPALRPAGRTLVVENTAAGHHALVLALRAAAPVLVGHEAIKSGLPHREAW